MSTVIGAAAEVNTGDTAWMLVATASAPIDIMNVFSVFFERTRPA